MKLEHKLQFEIVTYVWNNYPDTRGLLFAINNNSKNAIQGAINKGIGVVAGIPDLCFIWNSKTYFFELKAETGILSKKQIEIHKLFKKHNIEVYVVRSLKEFEKIFKEIVNGTNSK